LREGGLTRGILEVRSDRGRLLSSGPAYAMSDVRVVVEVHAHPPYSVSEYHFPPAFRAKQIFLVTQVPTRY